jgi:hypothetical protein
VVIKQRCIPLESPEDWKEALCGVKHTFGHTWENCYAMHLTTGLRTYLYSFEKEDMRIVCPIAERDFGGYIDIVKPFGFSGFVGNGECAEFSDYWSSFVRERGYVCGYLGLNPIFDFGNHFDSGSIYQYDTIYVLDLIPSIDEMFADLDTNRKRQLKHWDDIVSSLVFEKSVLENSFHDLYYCFLRSRNADPVYYFSDETLSFLFNLDNVVLVGIRNGEKVVAVSVFTYTPDVGEYLFGISLPEGRKHSAALVWYGIHHLKSLGIPILNLGGGSAGTAAFKRRFGAKARPLRCLKEVYDQGVYEVLCHEANVGPQDTTGYFPAYRKKEFELLKRKFQSGPD